MERIALPEPNYVEDAEINNDNLFEYLQISEDSVFRGNTRFAPEFDLELIEPFLKDLHQAEQLGYMFSEEERDKLQFNDPKQIKNPLLQEIEKQRQAMWKRLISHQKPVERYRSIYFDDYDDKIKISAITYGHYSGVDDVDTFLLFEEGYTPLFEVHSHPSDSLFSNADYQRLIMDATKRGGLRILRGAILICPNVQLLALATPNTMFVSPNQVDLFRERYNLERSEAGVRIREINMQLGMIINRPFLLWRDLVVDLHKQIYREGRYKDRGLYTEDEFKEEVDRLGRKYIADVDELLDNFINRSKAETISLKNERNRLCNQVEWEIAREVNPKLYLSTDFRHFREFAV